MSGVSCMTNRLLTLLLHARSAEEDSRRKEVILNVLLLSSMALFAIAIVVNFFVSILRPETYEANSVGMSLLAIILLIVSALYLLSKKGYFRASAHILVGIFFLFSFLMEYRWGVDLTASLLLYALIIVMSGILISTYFAFLATGIIAATILTLGHLQTVGLIATDHSWRFQDWNQSDSIMTAIIFLIIAVVSWLSNREIERSLKRARASEQALRVERDNLELTVEARTKELKQAQMEQISQLYRFAEFGRLSSGLFHDLMNPLTAVSMNLDHAASTRDGKGDVATAQEYVEQALTAARRMERFIGAVRKQIGKQQENVPFVITDEAKDVLDILSYKAHKSGVELRLIAPQSITITGDPVRWSQALLNLVTNGIDAYDHAFNEEARVVTVTLRQEQAMIVGTVADHGSGIQDADRQRVFEPFFTTKAGEATRGTGIGLSMVKKIIEEDFGGMITFISTPGSGTTFTLLLPLHPLSHEHTPTRPSQDQG